MVTSLSPRAKWVFGSLLGAGVVSGALGFAYRAQSRAAEGLRAQALAQGLVVTSFAQQNHLFSVEFRDVSLHFRVAPSIRLALDHAELLGVLTRDPRLVIDELGLRLSGEPTHIYEEWVSFPTWKGLSVSWQRLRVEYQQRELGKVELEDVRFERASEKQVVRAGTAKLPNGAAFSDVVFWVGKRNQLLEMGFGDLPGQPPPAQLGYFASSGVASQWMFNARHQPVRPFARALGWDLGEAFEPSRAVSSLSLIVPDDAARPTRTSIEIGMDAFPKPRWPDGSALLGDTLALAAYFPYPTDRGGRFAVPKVSVSFALFTLSGAGTMAWGKAPSLSFDVAGKLTCAQLRGNLSPSIYLDQVRQYLEPEPKLSSSDAAARRKEEVELRLELSVDQANPRAGKAKWHLSGGCGMPELSDR